MERVVEWTFEGDLKSSCISERVWFVGNRTRYQSGVYVSTWESGRNVNLSGTAIIINFITASNLWFGVVFLYPQAFFLPN